MDKFEFMQLVDDVYAECSTEKEIAARMNQMIECVKIQGQLAIEYLRVGILGEQQN